jgi:MSHA type pilus biogenesis protein MshL
MTQYGIRCCKGLLPCLICLALISCAAVQRSEDAVRRTKIDIDRDVRAPAEAPPVISPPSPPPKVPDLQPVAENITPLKTRIVNVTARDTALRDVLHAIAEATSLNLVMEKDVDPEAKVNMTLKNVTAEQALNTVFASVDYFYTIKENMLIVRAVETRVFELGHPALEQKYQLDVGGDILSETTSGTSSGGGSSGSTSSSSGSGVRGSITQTMKGDETAFKFWDAVERSLSSLLGVSATTQPGAATASSQSFTVNRLTGTIVVTASKGNLQKVDTYVSTVRRVIDRQVLVEAKIIEVQLSDTFKFGIDWNYVAGDVDLSTINFANVIQPSEPALRIGVTNSRFSPVLKALEEQGDVRVLANPRVNIMNGQTALLSVGRNVTFISRVESSTISGGSGLSQSFSVQTGSVLSGIMIGLVPYINEKGEISLTVTPIVSNLVELKEEPIGLVTSNQITISLPTVDLRELSTTVKVWDGQTVVIGGLISKTESLKDSQVPVLGNLPWLGLLFKSREKIQQRTELVVLLQPFLITK